MKLRLYPLMNELDGEGGDLGGGEEFDDSASPPDETPEGWLRDIDEETAYSTLQQARQFPDHLRGLESRIYGKMGPVFDRLQQVEKSMGTRVSLDADRIKKALDAYDASGALSEALVPALTEALNVNPLNEDSLRPFIEPIQSQNQQWAAEQIVLANYDPEEIADIIPETENGRFRPETQRQKDFVDWYSQQGYDMQQALLQFGAPYVRALRRFEKWEADRIQERNKAAGAQSNRLNGGRQPSSQGRRPRAAGPQTAEEAFLAGFNEVD